MVLLASARLGLETRFQQRAAHAAAADITQCPEAQPCSDLPVLCVRVGVVTGRFIGQSEGEALVFVQQPEGGAVEFLVKEIIAGGSGHAPVVMYFQRCGTGDLATVIFRIGIGARRLDLGIGE